MKSYSESLTVSCPKSASRSGSCALSPVPPPSPPRPPPPYPPLPPPYPPPPPPQWFPSSPPVAWVWVRVFLRRFPLRLGLLWVFGILIPTMIMMMMMMGTMITIIIIMNSNTLINDCRFVDRRAIIFVTVVDLGQLP